MFNSQLIPFFLARFARYKCRIARYILRNKQLLNSYTILRKKKIFVRHKQVNCEIKKIATNFFYPITETTTIKNTELQDVNSIQQRKKNCTTRSKLGIARKTEFQI